MVASPVIGFVGGFLVMGLFYFLLRSARPRFVNRFFGKAQIASAGFMGFAHGLADAQKTMGVITLALVSATAAGSFTQLPDWLGFLRMGKSMASEQSIRIVMRADATPEELRQAAATLESEGAQLRPGEFREAFLTLSAKTFENLGDGEAASRVGQLATETHTAIVAAENARFLPKIPLIGSIMAAKHIRWETVLEKEMAAAVEKSGRPLPAAAAKVVDLSPDVPIWIKIICSLTMAAGTMAGGWRIIKTLGHKMVKLQPVHGFAAETTAATILAVTGGLGMTVSTTHSVTTAIMGVGCAKRFNALKLGLVERILWAWVLTLPAAGFSAYLFVEIFRFFGWIA
ncbi:MAG TPA: inorganic phosphate transporter, partial [Bacteroidia bacterium]|nr:inorganic phosphate transporter [Bacteroidia bacterium]